MTSRFYALLARMKYIDRWGLMHSARRENLSEHCLQTAFIAQALVVLHCRRFGGDLDPEHAAVLAMFHDATEIITGDLPTPVKYFNPELRAAYRTAERAAADRLVESLPGDMREDLAPYIRGDDGAYAPFIKAADKLSALLKCVEEEGMGNTEFRDARASLESVLREMHMPEVDAFLADFLGGYGETLDALTGRR